MQVFRRQADRYRDLVLAVARDREYISGSSSATTVKECRSVYSPPPPPSSYSLDHGKEEVESAVPQAMLSWDVQRVDGFSVPFGGI